MPHRNWVSEIKIPLIESKSWVIDFHQNYDVIKKQVLDIVSRQKEIQYKTKFPIYFDEHLLNEIFKILQKGLVLQWWNFFWNIPENIAWNIASKLHIILGDENIVSIIILLLLTWVLEISDNDINKFAIELETKIYHQNLQKINEKILESGGKIRYSWVITDIYYLLNQEKRHKEKGQIINAEEPKINEVKSPKDRRIIRSRTELLHPNYNVKNIFSLKRKIKKDDTIASEILKAYFPEDFFDVSKILEKWRINFEEEFLQRNPTIIERISKLLFPDIERAKVKLRTSYILDTCWNTIIDADNYARIITNDGSPMPPIVEIEMSQLKYLNEIINLLNLDNAYFSTWWSQKAINDLWWGDSYLIKWNNSSYNFFQKINEIQVQLNKMMQNWYFDRFQ